ncbi:MAG: EamA family transporter [Pseudomonadota bacterium]
MGGDVNTRLELSLLALLALLWGSSYLFIKVAVAEIPPITLIAARVFGAALLLMIVLWLRGERLPRDRTTWGLLTVQAFFNSIAAWTVLAWGQQFVDAGLASVLNSTSPIFVLLIALAATNRQRPPMIKVAGALIGIVGVVLVIGVDRLRGLGQQVAGQIACLIGAALYACAALFGTRFNDLGPVVTATGTMIIATVALLPIAFAFDRPWQLAPSYAAIVATLFLSIFCTGLAMLLYFRLLRTLGSLGVASQAYLRAGVGVALGAIILGESLSPVVAIGLLATILGVAMINWPSSDNRRQRR